jgi:hypothetical protein
MEPTRQTVCVIMAPWCAAVFEALDGLGADRDQETVQEI